MTDRALLRALLGAIRGFIEELEGLVERDGPVGVAGAGGEGIEVSGRPVRRGGLGVQAVDPEDPDRRFKV